MGSYWRRWPRCLNDNTQNKTESNVGTTKLQRVRTTPGSRLRRVSRINNRELWRWGWGVKALLQPANFTLGTDATLNTETHKNSVRITAPKSVNAWKRKHKNQINHYDKQRQVFMANSTVWQSKWKPMVEPRLAKPNIYLHASTHWLQFYKEAAIDIRLIRSFTLSFGHRDTSSNKSNLAKLELRKCGRCIWVILYALICFYYFCTK